MVGDERYDDRLADPCEDGPRATAQSFQRGALDELAGDRPRRARRGPCARRSTCWRRSRSATLAGDRAPARPAAGRRATCGARGSCWRSSARMQRADTPERLDAYVGAAPRDPRVPRGRRRHRARRASRRAVTRPRVVAERADRAGRAAAAHRRRRTRRRSRRSPRRRRGARAGRRRDPRRGRARAYQRYLEALREYLPARDRDDRAVGAARRRRDVRRADPRVDDAAARGAGGARHRRRASGEIQEERAAIAARLGFATPRDGPRRAQGDAARTPPTRARHCVELAADQVQRGWDAAPAFFGRLPSENCEVRAGRGVPRGRHAVRVLPAARPPTARAPACTT